MDLLWLLRKVLRNLSARRDRSRGLMRLSLLLWRVGVGVLLSLVVVGNLLLLLLLLVLVVGAWLLLLCGSRRERVMTVLLVCHLDGQGSKGSSLLDWDDCWRPLGLGSLTRSAR